MCIPPKEGVEAGKHSVVFPNLLEAQNFDKYHKLGKYVW